MSILALAQTQMNCDGTLIKVSTYDERKSLRIRTKADELDTFNYNEHNLDMPIHLGATSKAQWGLTACASERKAPPSSNELFRSDYSTLTDWRERSNARTKTVTITHYTH